MVQFNNYELSAEQRRLETIKYNRRMELRADFLKHQSNPHVHGNGGTLVRGDFSQFFSSYND